MALTKTTKILIDGKCEVNGAEIKGFRAVIDTDNDNRLTLSPYDIDAAACKEHRKVVRADQAAFEDYAYEVQEAVIAAAEK